MKLRVEVKLRRDEEASGRMGEEEKRVKMFQVSRFKLDDAEDRGKTTTGRGSESASG